jgi:hypothetical protein
VLRRGVLQQEAAGARAERRIQRLVIVERCDHQDVRRGVDLCEQAPGRRNAVEARHADVHDHEVRAGVPGDDKCLLAVGGLAHDFDVWFDVEIMRKPVRTMAWSSAIRTRIAISQLRPVGARRP